MTAVQEEMERLIVDRESARCFGVREVERRELCECEGLAEGITQLLRQCQRLLQVVERLRRVSDLEEADAELVKRLR